MKKGNQGSQIGVVEADYLYNFLVDEIWTYKESGTMIIKNNYWKKGWSDFVDWATALSYEDEWW